MSPLGAPSSPPFTRTPAFRLASEVLALVSAVAEALPPHWRFLAVHLRRAPTVILIALAVSAGVTGKQRRKLVRLAQLRAFDLVGALHAAAAAPGVPGPQVEQAGTACLRLVKLLAPGR